MKKDFKTPNMEIVCLDTSDIVLGESNLMGGKLPGFEDVEIPE